MGPGVYNVIIIIYINTSQQPRVYLTGIYNIIIIIITLPSNTDRRCSTTDVYGGVHDF